MKLHLLAALLITCAFAPEISADVTADSLSMRTGMTDWVDPIHATPAGTHYVTYPTPSRGEGSEGSCLVYLPAGYGTDPTKRYPVIY